MDNHTIAHHLRKRADELEETGANLFRVRAYRRGAAIVAMYPRPLARLLAERGSIGLQNIAGIGPRLSTHIEHLLKTGDMPPCDEPGPLRADPEDQLTSLPGVGRVVAERLRATLNVHTPSDLQHEDEIVLALVVGNKRAKRLVNMRNESSLDRQPQPHHEPSTEVLLTLDHDFRVFAASTAPGEIPVLTLDRDGWTYRISFSSHALAHRLGLTRDWVVIRFARNRIHGERIVVTETRQHLFGKRVVRGRERECQGCWAS